MSTNNKDADGNKKADSTSQKYEKNFESLLGSQKVSEQEKAMMEQ